MLWDVTEVQHGRLTKKELCSVIPVSYKFTRPVFRYMATSKANSPWCPNPCVMTAVYGFRKKLKTPRRYRQVRNTRTTFRTKTAIFIWNAAIRHSETWFRAMLLHVLPKKDAMQATVWTIPVRPYSWILNTPLNNWDATQSKNDMAICFRCMKKSQPLTPTITQWWFIRLSTIPWEDYG